jgi:alpha-methylacyl-CoA racemase
MEVVGGLEDDPRREQAQPSEGSVAKRGGPLSGVRVIELAGIGPVPFAATLLADLGADVIRVDRVAESRLPEGHVLADAFAGRDVLGRSRRRIAVDLKQPEGVDVVLRLVERCDVLLEGWRPGVAERLGVGPQECLARNPRLVCGRMTGWGQDGPLAGAAGHDIDYIALTGALHAIGRRGQPPTVPLALVGDFGGGGCFLAVGVLAALMERQRSGQGQVIDSAIVDGAAMLNAVAFGLAQRGAWSERGTNFMDTGAYFYDVYETADGRFIAVGALEPAFHAELLARTGLDGPDGLDPAGQWDTGTWEERRQRLATVFRTRTRDEWCRLLEGTDACVAPVLDMKEAPRHPHMRARGTFVEVGGELQPAPAPRFSRTPATPPLPAAEPGMHTDAVLLEYGFSSAEVEQLRAAGVTAASTAGPR